LEIVHRTAPCRNVPVTFTLGIMVANYSDIESTTTILFWFWAAFVAIGSLALWRSLRRYERPQTSILVALAVVVGPVLATLTLFPLVYTLTSLPLLKMFALTFWQDEVTTGALALRVTSLLLTYQLARAVARFIPRRIELIAARKVRGLSDDDVADFTTSVVPNERVLWHRNDLMSLAFFQFSFYLVALAAMWGCAIAGIHTLWTALAAWALLFIVDDWGVIADYCHHFDSLPMTAHVAKVFCVDLLLLIAVPAALYPAQLGAIWVALSLALVASGLLVLMFFCRARVLGRQDA
jgi:hypothetical protein